jgi:hypothetical protein
MLKNLKEKRDYKKRFKELQAIVNDLLKEKHKLLEENDFFREEMKKLTRERNIMRGGITK